MELIFELSLLKRKLPDTVAEKAGFHRMFLHAVLLICDSAIFSADGKEVLQIAHSTNRVCDTGVSLLAENCTGLPMQGLLAVTLCLCHIGTHGIIYVNGQQATKSECDLL